MARIRAVKPEFFKHLELNELEDAHPELRIMLVYEGLWVQSDKNGVFLYNAKVLKNEILPYVNFDIQKSLDVLEKDGYFIKYKYEKREYGYISNFKKYQFPTKQEKDAPAKYPLPPDNGVNNVPETNENDSTNHTNNVSDNHINAEGLKDKGVQDKGYTDSGTDVNNKTLFISLWQKNSDVFNAFARLESPDDFNAFWDQCDFPPGQIETAVNNVANAVRAGNLRRIHVPATPDRFVLKGWLQRGLDDFISQEDHKEQEREAARQEAYAKAEAVSSDYEKSRELAIQTDFSLADIFKQRLRANAQAP